MAISLSVHIVSPMTYTVGMLLRVFFSLFIFATAISFAGCSAGRISEENSRLRRENLELSDKLKNQDAQILRLRGQVDGLASKLNAQGKTIPGVKAGDIPVATRITFGRYSGAFDENGDGTSGTIRIYVLTEDQKGRFIPVAGKAILQVVLIDADEGAKELARKVYEPKAWDEAYTNGLTGTHYTLEAKVGRPTALDGQSVTVKVTLTDAATGGTLTHQSAVNLNTTE